MDVRPMTCSITFRLFRDPVILRDGNTYERKAIEEMLDRNGGLPIRCPLDPSKLCNNKADMLPNHSMKTMVAEFMWKNPRDKLVIDLKKEKEAADLKKSEELMETASSSLASAAKLGNKDASALLSLLKKRKARE